MKKKVPSSQFIDSITFVRSLPTVSRVTACMFHFLVTVSPMAEAPETKKKRESRDMPEEEAGELPKGWEKRMSRTSSESVRLLGVVDPRLSRFLIASFPIASPLLILREIDTFPLYC